ncbi:MAG: hypothetical protein EBR55_09800, partial [Chitinophagia bacterium]|nr:hypothetical protein [Chitinophagia bacterium]
MKINLRILALVSLAVLSFSSCIKKDFDAPPDQSSIDPKLACNKTIAQIKALYNSATAVRIDSDYTVYGIVTADDKSGNFYKQIIIQDSTAGLAVLIDNASLFNEYPVGRKVYIKLKGLYMSKYAATPQLGYLPDATGSISNILAQLTNTATFSYYVNRLVTIDNAEFTSSDMGKPYADPASIASGTSRNIEECSSTKTIQLRSSGYANFQPLLTPLGKGKITGIFTLYNSTPQLVIRDTNDVKFAGLRCNGSTGIIPMVSIDSIRKLGIGIKLGEYKIKGIVISSADSGNLSKGNMVIQDGNKGITIYLGSTTVVPYKPGDSVIVDITGDSLINYKGTTEIKGATLSSVTKVGTGTIIPKVLTIAQLNANFANYEATLVQVLNANVSGGGTYSGSKTLT